MSRIFSPGKLLLTSEYVVLDGALALAVPTRQGQAFFCEEKHDGNARVRWQAFHQDKLWLDAVICYRSWKVRETNLPDAAAFILKVLQNVQKISDIRFLSDDTYYIRTNLEFPPDYGWGSSSTLMNDVAEWAGCDPFLLNERSLGGSGYDIAVAQAKTAILYQLRGEERSVQKVDFRPGFSDELLLVHLNHKQDSREGIRQYRTRLKPELLVEEFSELTLKVLKAEDIDDFCHLLEIHEEKLSDFLGIPTMKQQMFKDLPVFVKSLGAWGGDFVLSRKFPGYKEWFWEHGFQTVLHYDDVIY
ncbi:GYDIA family GHMP kinase [Weeksellaceae bacterium A-14]